MPINVMQKPIYESFEMLHPDGTLMCNCSYKKARWYIERDLASWIDDKTFQLKFEPQGHGKSNLNYYTQKIENRCVVCGSKDKLNRHHVVPYVFRSRFPLELKKSNNHDIVATCVDCHEIYETYATDLKAQLAKNCGVSINGVMTDIQKNNKKIVSARKILQKIKDGLLIQDGIKVNIPIEKLQGLMIKAAENVIGEDNLNRTLWADKIIENILAENKLFEFVKMWRKHFIDYMHPKFLPKYWSVDHKLEISEINNRKEK
jgi:hypothetical protein